MKLHRGAPHSSLVALPLPALVLRDTYKWLFPPAPCSASGSPLCSFLILDDFRTRTAPLQDELSLWTRHLGAWVRTLDLRGAPDGALLSLVTSTCLRIVSVNLSGVPGVTDEVSVPLVCLLRSRVRFVIAIFLGSWE